ncbi:hypothetical protein IHN32_10875 [Deinococcus sp. 14RED07]|uniref:hypothetical protein n=1 Tax=Deinococcus sp. 14RED07 TaxID=2745874 RepID=UPI001E546B51|nr:hypothetical protein [Deinococcus sp. 14RED07]MCD0176446.1 hypothetical protein [Deinococcus sp. 14RED07]
MKKDLIHLYLRAKQISDEHLFIAFMADDGVIYAITEIGTTLRVYHSERHVPIIMDRLEALDAGLLDALVQITANADDADDNVMFGQEGRAAKELSKYSSVPTVVDSYRLDDLGKPMEKFFVDFPKRTLN